MVQELTYYLSVSGEAAEVSSEGLRTILGQVEADLYRSATYGQVVSSLQGLPTEVSRQVQRMVQAVGREAIRLAFRRLVKKRYTGTLQTEEAPEAQLAQPALNPEAVQAAPHPSAPCASPERMAVNPVNPSEADRVGGPVTATIAPPEPAVEKAIALPVMVKPAIATKESRLRRQRKPTRKELAAQAAIQTWENRLREIGQEIQQVRQTRAMSLYQLHARTQIPLYQLEALEGGQVDRLPEDVYIRGFLRRIGDALCLDSAAVVNSLPTPVDPAKAVLPSWYHPQVKTGGAALQLRPVHLYLGYAALLAGGLTWISQQSAPRDANTSTQYLPPPTTAPSDHTSSGIQGANQLKSAKAGMVLPGTIAPPEISPL